MVNGSLPNACIICGKQRIIVSSSQEMIGNTMVTSTEMACPDADCQKKLDKQLREEKRKRESAKATFGYNFRNKGPNLSKNQKPIKA